MLSMRLCLKRTDYTKIEGAFPWAVHAHEADATNSNAVCHCKVRALRQRSAYPKDPLLTKCAEQADPMMHVTSWLDMNEA